MMIHDWQPRSRLMQKAPPPSILMGTGASERSSSEGASLWKPIGT